MPIALSWQRCEGGIVFLCGMLIALLHADMLSWWQILLLFFAPDLSFAAYLLGSRVGAWAYNSVHLYGFGAAFLAYGLVQDADLAAALGALWLAHSGFDRALGYGLKSPESFTLTHLGRIGKAAKSR